jgi:hypothetical protein
VDDVHDIVPVLLRRHAAQRMLVCPRLITEHIPRRPDRRSAT